MRLRFTDPELEREFIEQNIEQSVRRFRIGILFGIFLYAIFGILDNVIVGPLKVVIWLIRFLIVIPFVTLMFCLTFVKFFKKKIQLIASLSAIVGGFGILAMLAIIKPPAMYLYSQGLTLVMFFDFVLLGLRFSYALVNGLILLIGFQIVSLIINPLPREVFINNNFFLVSTFLGGAFVSYILEKLERENFAKYKVLSQVASVDGLTGVLNRTHFFKKFNDVLHYTSKTGGILTFCMIDLDNFKEVNDSYGHLKGDELLISFGKNLLNSFRSTDFVGRIGGDEFGVLISGVGDKSRILEAFKKVKNNFVNLQGDISPKITFSAGCVIIALGSQNFEQLYYYTTADWALSAAKANKNSLCIVSSNKNILYVDKIEG